MEKDLTMNSMWLDDQTPNYYYDYDGIMRFHNTIIKKLLRAAPKTITIEDEINIADASYEAALVFKKRDIDRKEIKNWTLRELLNTITLMVVNNENEELFNEVIPLYKGL